MGSEFLGLRMKSRTKRFLWLRMKSDFMHDKFFSVSEFHLFSDFRVFIYCRAHICRF